MSGEGFAFRPEFVVDLFLRGFQGKATPTLEEVQGQVDRLLIGPFAELKPHQKTIVDEILRRIDVRIGSASVLDDVVDHEPWLDKVDRSAWRLWPRLEQYLREIERLPTSVLDELNRSTDQVLERLESPTREGKWDRRGLVVGHVQSGKTTHYTGLAAKAIDAGYKVVVVLAGIHNNLRSQTHERIDKHLIGRDSMALDPDAPAPPRLAGVGEYARQLALPEPAFSILTCTTAAENGDFRQNTAQRVWFQVNEGARLVMVVKKNATILRKLRDWLRTLLADVSAMGGEGLIRHPTLFIDDEADHASVNTKDPDEDPSRINQLIRELLISFSHVGFVGYTATPFANIFIDPTASLDTTRFGPDLFPKSFIVNLKPPSDYIGPSVVFGHPGDDSVGIPRQDPLPMYVGVEDFQPWIASPHKKDFEPGPMPQSLKDAIRLFVIACAVRFLRGDTKAHNSMLVLRAS